MKIVFFTILSNQADSVPYGPCALAAYVAQERKCLQDTVEMRLLAAPPHLRQTTVVERIAAEKPDVIAVSLYIWNHEPMLRLLRMLRAHVPDAKILLGGPQASGTVASIATLLKRGVVDALITGEGEIALVDTLAEIIDGRLSDQTSGSPIQSLDSLPNPFLTNPFLKRQLLTSRTAIIEGARGCPYRCSFCDQGWRKARSRSLDLIKEDLAKLYHAGARMVYFLDPTFNYQPARMRNLLSYMRESLPRMKISAEIKVDRLGDEDIEAMRGVVAFVEAGLQTTNSETLSRIQRPEKMERVWSNLNKLNEGGITVAVNTIFGLPGETLDDWLISLDTCFASTQATITSTCLKILPNTQIDATKAQYCYEWDEDRLFRATRSNTMSQGHFLLAQALSQKLQALQDGPSGLPKHLRALIRSRYEGKISAFLMDRLTTQINQGAIENYVHSSAKRYAKA